MCIEKLACNYKILTINFVLLITCNMCLSQNDGLNKPVVTITSGDIIGSIMKTRLGTDIYAFRGIKYAEAPVGNLRFKPAIPVKPWKDTFDASKDGPSCFQPNEATSSDDCLRLNVYTTQYPNPNITKSPVIVFIHGGKFSTSSGRSDEIGPQYLLDEDVVLVTINSRIGPIGYTATGDDLAPGNLGLKDQVEALKWVQNNIASFNGDPTSVTLVGFSSGGWSVILHMLSPMSRGLFNRVVSMSGAPTAIVPFQYHQKEIAKKQADFVGCPSNNTQEMLDCFETIPGKKFTETADKFSVFNGDPQRIWLPVVEPYITNGDRFITDQPVNLIRKREFTSVPLLTGSTLDEYRFKAAQAVIEAKNGDDSMFDYFDENWNFIAPISFMYERNTSQSERISQQIRNFYFKKEKIGLQNWKSLANAYADILTSFSIRRLVDLMSEYSDQPVYYYHFSYQGRYSMRNWPGTEKPFGVSHGDHMQYIFYMQKDFPYFEPDAPEINTVRRMTAILASFAKTGNPIPQNNSLFNGVTWDPYDKDKKQYMELNADLEMKEGGFNNDRMEALDNIFGM